MKSLLALLVGIALMGFVGTAYAADDKTPPPAPAPAAGKDAKKEKNVRGEVVKVEGAKVTVKTKEKEIVVETDDKTQVVIEGNPGQVADLKAGQKVIIT